MDGTKCSGKDCPVKEKCYRFTARANAYRQSYFFQPPFKEVDGVFTCKMYWGEQADAIWKQLKDITDDK